MAAPYGLLAPQQPQGWQGLLGGVGNFFGNNSNTLTALGTDLLNYSRSPVGPIFNQQALAYGMKGDQEKRQQKKTQKFLMDKFGMSSQEAEAGAGDKDLLNLLMKPPKAWSKLDDNTLFDPVSGEVKDVGAEPENAERLTTITGIRKDFENQPGVNRYRSSQPVLQSMESSINDTSAMSDLDFVYGMAQIYDPDSVVRETEMGFVIDSQSVPEALKNRLAKALEGTGQLGIQARRDLVNAAGRRVQSYRSQAELETKFYTDLSMRHNIDPMDIVRPLEAPTQLQTMEPTPEPGQPPQDISEEDIQHTMRLHGLTREQVLERLNAP